MREPILLVRFPEGLDQINDVEIHFLALLFKCFRRTIKVKIESNAFRIRSQCLLPPIQLAVQRFHERIAQHHDPLAASDAYCSTS